jgi:hypothetical protein
VANNYEQIMALVNAGNKMGLSNAITRDNGIPLDLSSVYSSYNDAVIYAATRAIAYNGQPIAVITDTDATLYVITPVSQGNIEIDGISYDVYIKPVGGMTEGEIDARINTLINAADPDGGKVISNIQNLVKYVDENAGEITSLIGATNDNTAALAGINTTVTEYVADKVAAVTTPKASNEVTVDVDGTLGIGEVGTDKLVQSTGDVLILNGGNATTLL